MNLDIPQLLLGLAAERPIFHSEADFQHAFAWHLHKVLPSVEVRLEVRPTEHSNAAIDVLVRSGKAESALELKYLSNELRHNVGDETFSLRPQSAQDIRRYDVLRDLMRMERFRSARPAASAHVIVITNDASYWKPPRRNDTVDAAFRLHESREVTGSLEWGSAASDGTKKNRETPIVLKGRYAIRWQPFSVLMGRNGEFRFLHIAAEAR